MAHRETDFQMQNNKANSGSFALNDTLEKKLKVLVVDVNHRALAQGR